MSISIASTQRILSILAKEATRLESSISLTQKSINVAWIFSVPGDPCADLAFASLNSHKDILRQRKDELANLVVIIRELKEELRSKK
jgi:hypothetical protein